MFDSACFEACLPRFCHQSLIVGALSSELCLLLMNNNDYYALFLSSHILHTFLSSLLFYELNYDTIACRLIQISIIVSQWKVNLPQFRLSLGRQRNAALTD